MLFLFILALTGCEVMPTVRYKPTLHNPFVGEMKTVAVVPFYNYTDNPNVNGREFAQFFALELQKIPGFKVIANKVVEETMTEYDLYKFETVDDIRYLAQLLKVDAVVIGKIHGFSMNYPPYAKFETEWYNVNPFLHYIPRGTGLPWGTEYEKYIPEKIVMEAEMELAEAQIKTQTPKFDPIKPKRKPEDDESGEDEDIEPVPPKEARKQNTIRLVAATIPNNMNVESTEEADLDKLAVRRQNLSMDRHLASTGVPYVPEGSAVTDREKKETAFRFDSEHPFRHGPWLSETAPENQLPWSSQNPVPAMRQSMANPGGYEGNYPGFPQPQGLTAQQLSEYGWVAQPITPVPPMMQTMPGMPVAGHSGQVMGEPDRFPGLPEDWPDPRGFIPEGPKAERPVGKIKNEGPVLSHTNVYNGNDSGFMQALDDYNLLFRDDKRIGGKQTILTNRNEFIAFCCRLHIWEIFSSRGGAGPAERIVRQWKPWYGGEKPH
ncbi:MAG: hypothetical protein LBH00_06830 [Planctomycetaceae bacterium]|jgi:hypothetical protein|nr:hypothetical protein [Planctomycetaceae bacterium]